MSRYHTTGINPETNKSVDIHYGYDQVPGFPAGYFFQVYSREKEDMDSDPLGEGLLVNEGFVKGISKKQLNDLAKHWQCRVTKV